jgi:hypothetical protein
MRDRMSGVPSRSSFDDAPSQRDIAPPRRRPTNGTGSVAFSGVPSARKCREADPYGYRGGDSEMAAAIEASKRSAEADAARKRREGQADRDLEEAMRLSREEDEKRRHEQDAQAQNALFDDAFQA